MIAETIPEAYDAIGKQVSQPFSRRKGPHSTFPMGRYISQPLKVECRSVADIRNFLLGCKYVSDQELFGRPEYWQPPDEFEREKKGDCEDFALWTWRQLLNMGYHARFVGGSAGRYGAGHAWVEYVQDGRWFLFEPLYCKLGYTMPRLSTLRYDPRYSVCWDGKKLRYFAHKKPVPGVKASAVVLLAPEYLVFWLWIWIRILIRLPQITWNILRLRVFKRSLRTVQRNQGR